MFLGLGVQSVCHEHIREWRVHGDPGVEHSSPEDAQHKVRVLYLNTLVCAQGIQNMAMNKYVKGWH